MKRRTQSSLQKREDLFNRFLATKPDRVKARSLRTGDVPGIVIDKERLSRPHPG